MRQQRFKYLIERPVFLAETPVFSETIPMDVLSEVLRTVRLRGALFFNGEFSAPWCLLSARSASAAPYLSSLLGGSGAGTSAPERLIVFHFLTEGRAYARLPDGRREELTSGDIVILPHGDAHFLGNGSPEKPVDSFKTFAKNLTQGLKAAQFGGGGEVTRFVCGFMACEPRLSDVFLVGLPPLLKVRVANQPSGQWLEHSIRFSVDHASGSSAGSGLVLAKLAEVLFVETLRCYVNTLPPSQTGWLAGARDPHVGQALALLHREPSHPWTVPDLARRTGLSRTRLAERFRHFLGESPMAYLAQWRLKLGAEILQSAEDSIAEIAESVGYGSEAAFNRAFKREFGCPPAQFRRQYKARAE
jgi:AraC-like DNA-binding protein